MFRFVKYAFLLCGSSLVGCIDAPADGATPGEPGSFSTGGDPSDPSVAPPVSIVPDEVGSLIGVSYLAPPGTEWQLTAHGNQNGGSGPTTIGGGIIYAVSVYSGNFVDSMQVAYYIPSNNTDNLYRTGDFFAGSPRIGGGGGNNNGWTYCPGGYGVVGVQGRANAYVDAIGIICGSVSNPAAQRVYLQVWGGAGGNSFLDDCGWDSSLTAFALKGGTFVDWEQPYCRRNH